MDAHHSAHAMAMASGEVMQSINEKRSLNYYWRLLATGMSFTLFGVGGVLLGGLVFPLLLLLPHQKTRTRLARATIQKAFRFFIEFMRFMGVLTYEVHGFEQLKNRRGLLIIANHPSLLDVVFLGAFLDDVDCIVKSALFKNPVMIGPVRAARYIANNIKDPEALISTCTQRLSKQANLIVFPEGTRTVTHQGYRLQRGASNIAIRAHISPTPILIQCAPPSLRKGERWYNIPFKKMHFSLSVQEDFPISAYDGLSSGIAARQLTQDLTHYFSERIPNG